MSLISPVLCRAGSHLMTFWAGSYGTTVAVLMAVVSAALGFVEPRRPWRWGFALVSLPLLILLATDPFHRDPPGREGMAALWPLVAAGLVAWGGVCGLFGYLGALLRHLVSRLWNRPSSA